MKIKTLAVTLTWMGTMMLTTEVVRAQATACAPNCSAAALGDKVRVPWNCAQYAVCVDLHGDGFLFPADPIDCPEDEYFEPSHDIARCDPIADANPGFCGELCDPCEVQCTTPGDISPDPTDCSTYYVCIAQGATSPVQCSSGADIYYDFINGDCQSDKSRCFDQFCNVCDVHCTKESSLPDPYDCTKYYYCNPPQLVHVQCPPGEIFDRSTHICSVSAQCTEDCLANTFKSIVDKKNRK